MNDLNIKLPILIYLKNNQMSNIFGYVLTIG